MFGTIYRNKWPATKFRAVLWFLVAVMAIATGLALAFYTNYGLGLAAFVFLIGALPLSAALLYAKLYVTEIRAIGSTTEIDVLNLSGQTTMRFPTAALCCPSAHRARILAPREHHMRTPWVGLKAEGRRLLFIVDLKAEEIDRDALGSLGAGAE
jgi:hypothetical protein